ncbi:MAG: S9 family peptidase, partial [Candidatus Eremiobacteraeota bacterium]|nr:S9 family peptidase [Candidatus Eremiobacteraeota bacterium]
MRRLVVLAVLLLAAKPALGAGLVYPPAPRGSVTDNYFGTTVPDPYRWLEDVDAPQTTGWVQAEGALTRSFLDAIPQRGAIRDAYRKLLNYERVSAPSHEGRYWVFTRNSGLQNQSVLYARNTENGPARVLLDPNTLSADGTVALAGESFTRDGDLMAYATQSSGADWLTWRVRDVGTGRDLRDVIRWSKFSNAAWVGHDGFYY